MVSVPKLRRRRRARQGLRFESLEMRRVFDGGLADAVASSLPEEPAEAVLFEEVSYEKVEADPASDVLFAVRTLSAADLEAIDGQVEIRALSVDDLDAVPVMFRMLDAEGDTTEFETPVLMSATAILDGDERSDAGDVVLYMLGGSDEGAADDSEIRTLESGVEYQTTSEVETTSFTPEVRLRAELVDSAGQPITSVEAGQSFRLNIYVEDLRQESHGTYAAYLDASFDQQFVGAGDGIVYGDAFVNGHSGVVQPGLVNELGGFATITPLGSGEHLLASVSLVARQTGTVDFNLSAASDYGNDVLLYGSNQAVDLSKIAFEGASLQITAMWQNPESALDVDGDGHVAPLDVLLCVNELNAGGNQRLTPERFAGFLSAGQSPIFFDVNGDGGLTPLDTIIIINQLNDMTPPAGVAGILPGEPVGDDRQTDEISLSEESGDERWAAPLDESEEINDSEGDELSDTTSSSLAAQDASLVAIDESSVGDDSSRRVDPSATDAALDDGLLDEISDPLLDDELLAS